MDSISMIINGKQLFANGNINPMTNNWNGSLYFENFEDQFLKIESRREERSSRAGAPLDRSLRYLSNGARIVSGGALYAEIP